MKREEKKIKKKKSVSFHLLCGISGNLEYLKYTESALDVQCPAKIKHPSYVAVL